jgi:hypothetical protein
MEQEAEVLFARAKAYLSHQFPGAEIVNPLKLNHDHDKEWSSYMRVCLAELCTCDTIALIPNWSNSRGACIELDVAAVIGCKIIHLETYWLWNTYY